MCRALAAKDRALRVQPSSARLDEPEASLKKYPLYQIKMGATGRPFLFGGEGGIRTHGTENRTPDFESGTFDHSATSPEAAILTEARLLFTGAWTKFNSFAKLFPCAR